VGPSAEPGVYLKLNYFTEGAQPTRPHPGGQFAAPLKRLKFRMRGRKKHLQSGVATGK
jgi:hypothetical protein